ncbi:MAG: hypothetical protein WCT05_10540 [Lentisphaeria bacterium]
MFISTSPPIPSELAHRQLGDILDILQIVLADDKPFRLGWPYCRITVAEREADSMGKL